MEQLGEQFLPGNPIQPEDPQPRVHPQPGEPPMGQANQPVPPVKRMHQHDKMPGGGKLQPPPVIPQPAVHPRRTQDVQNPIGGAIPKQNQSEKPFSSTHQKEKIQVGIASKFPGTTDPTTKPSEGTTTRSTTIPQNRDVAPPIDVSAPNMQRVMALLGKAFSTTSQDERDQAYQKLHDLIILAPRFFSLHDLPIKPEWKTKQADRVFQSALQYRKIREENQRKARTTTSTTTSSIPSNTSTLSSTESRPASSAEGRPTRSTYKAPDIGPTPPVPIERKSRKDPSK